MSEAEISMILDTFMYLDYREAREGSSLREIISDLEHHPDYGGGGIHSGEYTVLKEAALNDEVGNLVICTQSVNMGYDSGTAACTFKAPDEDCYYVVYRGTGDGEWPDNGIGMTSEATTQQKRALSYFEETVEILEIGKEERLIVTGHSKGGNKAQFVTMETKYDAVVDACYSVDGQGFSEKAIEGWKERYGEGAYEKRRQKLYGIHGENDYVSVLGNSIIPGEQIRYVRTPVEKSNFAGYHDIKYMFASLTEDPVTGEYNTVFHGRKNSDTGAQGELGKYAMALSGTVMALSPDVRDGCAAVIMQLMEASKGEKKGLNGEKITLEDLKDFTFQGIPLIAGSLFQRKEGKALLSALFKKATFSVQISGNVNLYADYRGLTGQAQKTEALAAKIEKLAREIRQTADKLPLYMRGHAAFYHRIKLSAIEMERMKKTLLNFAQFQEESAAKYRRWDTGACR